MGCLCPKDSLIQDILDSHNEIRTIHHSPILKQNIELNELAEKYSKDIAEDKACNGNSYKGLFLGENIYICRGLTFDQKEMCNDWYNEKNNYDKQLNQYQKKTCHFTQMIWKETKEIGFGMYKKNGVYYAVVFYYPPGNTLGEYQENVFLPK